MGIILTRIPTNYFDDLVALSAPIPPSDLSLAELELRLKYMFKSKVSTIKSLIEFQDRVKLKSESYNHYYNEFG